MDNIQTEVLEIEFLTYSKGMTTISEEDFAKILLRFTNVENISAYLENVRQCIPDDKVQSSVGFGGENPQVLARDPELRRQRGVGVGGGGRGVMMKN